MTATYYEDLTWGMSMDEVAATLGGTVTRGKSSLVEQRSVNGVPVEVGFRFTDGGLSRIEMLVQRSYAQWGDGDRDEHAIEGFIRAKAGPYTERKAASMKWMLPTAKIWTYCDESLGAYWEKPPK